MKRQDDGGSGAGGVVMEATRSTHDGRLKLLQANEARRGTVVRVRDGHRRWQFAGMCGTVRHLWGPSEHAAVDVLLEDGSSELFWLDDLSVVDEDIAAV